MSTVIQAGEHPVRTLLVSRGYVIAFLLLFSMVYIRYETKQRFKRWVYAGFGIVIITLFLFATGTVWFAYPAPGVIWSVALTFVGFSAGAAAMWILVGPEDAFVEHHRESRFPEDDAESENEEP